MIALPSYNELVEDLTAFLKALRPEMSTSIDTDAGVRIQALAQALMGLQVNVAEVQKDVFPQFASADAVEKHASYRLGLNGRKGATSASGGMLHIKGEPGAILEAGSLLIHTDGTQYKLSEGGKIGPAGNAFISVESISKGSQSNKQPGEILTFESPPEGVATKAELTQALSGGTDQETIEALRQRLIQHYRNPPAGGRFADYWAWAMEIADTHSAYVYGPSSIAQWGRRGLGVVDVAILTHGTGRDRIPSDDHIQEVYEHIDRLRPATAKDFEILRPQPVPTPIDVRIHLEPGYELSSVKPKVEAVIKSYVDTLGPAKGVAYDPGQENWDDTLRVSKLLAAIVYHRYPGKTCGVKGVSDVEILSPQNNLTPTDHGAVELIVYDTITITQGGMP